MFSSFKQFKRASARLRCDGVDVVIAGQALALGTAPGQAVDNIASVNYSVGGVPQTVIRSAPGAGNSTPGASGGANTSSWSTARWICTSSKSARGRQRP